MRSQVTTGADSRETCKSVECATLLTKVSALKIQLFFFKGVIYVNVQ